MLNVQKQSEGHHRMALTFIPMSVMYGSASRDIIWYSFMYPFWRSFRIKAVSLWL